VGRSQDSFLEILACAAVVVMPGSNAGKSCGCCGAGQNRCGKRESDGEGARQRLHGRRDPFFLRKFNRSVFGNRFLKFDRRKASTVGHAWPLNASNIVLDELSDTSGDAGKFAWNFDAQW